MNKKHKLSLAILLALVAGNASAAFTSSALTTGGAAEASSILFAAVDENTSSANYGATFLYDLALGDAGLNYESFLNGTQGTNGSLNWDLSQNAAFSAFAADNSKLQWTVVGGEALTSSKSNVTTWGALTTENGTSSSFSTSVTPLLASVTTSGSIGAYFANINSVLAANSIATNVASIPSGSITNIAGLGALQVDASSVFANVGGIGSNTIPFWLLQNQNTSIRTPVPNVVSSIGTWSLSGNTLAYTSASASAVPLPATVWIFLSGLLGVMGLKRRAKHA
jgi:hypothetical protein